MGTALSDFMRSVLLLIAALAALLVLPASAAQTEKQRLDVVVSNFLAPSSEAVAQPKTPTSLTFTTLIEIAENETVSKLMSGVILIITILGWYIYRKLSRNDKSPYFCPKNWFDGKSPRMVCGFNLYHVLTALSAIMVVVMIIICLVRGLPL